MIQSSTLQTLELGDIILGESNLPMLQLIVNQNSTSETYWLSIKDNQFFIITKNNISETPLFISYHIDIQLLFSTMLEDAENIIKSIIITFFTQSDLTEGFKMNYSNTKVLTNYLNFISSYYK